MDSVCLEYHHCGRLNIIPPNISVSCMTKGTLQMWLGDGCWPRRIIQHYPNGPNIVTRVLIIWGRQTCQSQRKNQCDSRSRNWSDAFQRWRNSPQGHGFKWPLDAENNKGPDCPPEAAERASPADTLPLSQWHWFQTLAPRTLREHSCVTLSHEVAGELLQQQKEAHSSSSSWLSWSKSHSILAFHVDSCSFVVSSSREPSQPLGYLKNQAHKQWFPFSSEIFTLTQKWFLLCQWVTRVQWLMS